MDYKNYYKLTPEMIQQAETKQQNIKRIQALLDDIADNYIETVIIEYNLETGQIVPYQNIKIDGVLSKVRMHFNINGEYFESTVEIIDRGLANSRGGVYSRCKSKSEQFSGWKCFG